MSEGTWCETYIAEVEGKGYLTPSGGWTENGAMARGFTTIGELVGIYLDDHKQKAEEIVVWKRSPSVSKVGRVSDLIQYTIRQEYDRAVAKGQVSEVGVA